MIPSKTLLIILFLFCFTFAKAQQVPFQEGEGCLFNGKIYWNNIGTYGGTPLFNGYQTPCTGTYTDDPNDGRFISGANGTCTVWVNCTGTGKRNYKKGKLGVSNLPLDDYILPFAFLLAAYTFYRLKNNLKPVIN